MTCLIVLPFALSKRSVRCGALATRVQLAPVSLLMSTLNILLFLDSSSFWTSYIVLLCFYRLCIYKHYELWKPTSNIKQKPSHHIYSLHLPLTIVRTKYTSRNVSCLICATKLLVQSLVMKPKAQWKDSTNNHEAGVDSMSQSIEWFILSTVDPNADNLTWTSKCDIKTRGKGAGSRVPNVIWDPGT
jgi:hypothetical protein